MNNKWISVEDKPLVIYCSGQDYKGKTHEVWQVNEGVPEEFLAAIKYFDQRYPDKEFWWIRHCVIEDGTGLCIVGDDLENIPSGWDINQVQYYMPIPEPPTDKTNP